MNILDFVMVGSDDHEKSGDFYDAVFEPLKLKRVLKTQKYLGYAHSSDPEKVQFYVTHPVNGKDATFGNGTQITLLADVNGNFTKSIGAEFNWRGWGLRSKRYTMLLENGIVKKLVVEEGKCELTAAENFLKEI